MRVELREIIIHTLTRTDPNRFLGQDNFCPNIICIDCLLHEVINALTFSKQPQRKNKIVCRNSLAPRIYRNKT